MGYIKHRAFKEISADATKAVLVTETGDEPLARAARVGERLERGALEPARVPPRVEQDAAQRGRRQPVQIVTALERIAQWEQPQQVCAVRRTPQRVREMVFYFPIWDRSTYRPWQVRLGLDEGTLRNIDNFFGQVASTAEIAACWQPALSAAR